ncbi:PREDICTED: protein crumbs homolog 3 isoform X1 [Galeopterus variegatus]|uniref:Protein crumbs homolog 3 isoform X1 n=1 Tax=Galeopterus variegatus TaxID=482537 RepID=A0ABM0R0A3_GALVR|nr:PREDICTED: protein crumbs homolog 3 isoform X1 [Galeopterus variegatus]
MATPSLGLLLALGLPLLPARWGRAWGQISGGHYCYHRGLLHPGCLASGCGAGTVGAETSGEAADRGHLPAQQRGAVLPRSRGPGPPGLQGDGAGLPAHLGPLPCIRLPSLMCDLRGRQSPLWAVRPTHCLRIEWKKVI